MPAVDSPRSAGSSGCTGRRAAALVRLAVALAACSDPSAGPAKLSGPLSLPVYRAPRRSGPITVDGRLDEPAWRSAPEAILLDSLTGKPLRYSTTARILWDAESLYVAFSCRDDEAWARPGRKDDDPIYEDEVVEIFLDPTGGGTDYAEIEVSPANVRFDARFRSPRSDLAEALKWQSGARHAVRIERGPAGDRGWTVEMAIPLETLRGRSPLPRPGDRWRLNLFRLETHNRAGWREGGALSPPLRGDFHSLDRFGWLVFD